MPFIPFEDVPLYLGVNGHEGQFIFAESASISVSQPMSISRQVDDNIIQITSYGDGGSMVYEPQDFVEEIDFLVTLGPTNGPPRPLSTSIANIPAGTKILFPGNKELFFSNNIQPNGNDYVVSLYAESGFNLTEEEAQQGIFYPEYKNHASGPVVGSLNVNFYPNTGNLQSFFNITGQSDPSKFPPIDEERITGYIGNFRFQHAYLKSFEFSLSPNSFSQASASFDIYGTLDEDSTIIENYFNPDLYQQLSIAHGQNSQIGGTSKLGINHPLSFSYKIEVDRNPRYGIPTNNNYLNAKALNDRSDSNNSYGNFLVPDRVSKQKTTISMSLQGEGLNVDLLEDGFHGKQAKITASIYDLNYNDYGFDGTMNNNSTNGFMHTFNCNGTVMNQSLSVNSAGFLEGSISVAEIIQ
jgi:hypothetical protein